MLQFLRKYQKFFFGIVAVVIIASFCFFGTQGAMQAPAEIPDRRIGTLIDKSPLMQQEVDLLARFLSTSPNDRQMLEKGHMPNLFNDGVIQREFLQTGLLPLIAKSCFSEISAEVQERVDRVRAYRPYTHHQAPFLSSEAVWSRFFPSTKQKIQQLAGTPAGEDSLRLLGDLYLEQEQLPSDVLRRILMFQEQQYEWITHDSRLEHADLNLFGFQNLEDWLGPKLMRVLAQVILNGAAEARSQGYEVSEEEARRSLHENFFAGIKKTASERELTQQELQNVYQHQVQLLHRDERRIVSVWQKVLTFRRMMDDIGSAMVLDGSAYRQFSEFAGEKLRVNTYALPEALRLVNFRDLLKLQTYLDSIAISPGKKPSASLNLPHLFATPMDVQGRTPELALYRYRAEIAEVTFDTLASRVSLKQVYEWEIDNAHWQQLKVEFPALAQVAGATIEERYAALEALESELRSRINKSAREAIVREHPEWIEAAFAQAERKEVTFGLRQKGGQLPFIGVRDRDELYTALKSAPLKSENALALHPYRLDTDGYHFYEIVLLEPPSELTLLELAEASSDGTLDALLDKKLEAAYPEIRKKNTSLFQISNGVFKPLADVKDFVGAHLYADLLKSIESEAKESGVEWPKQEGDARFPQPLDLYAQYRLHSYLQTALAALSGGENEAGWVAGQNAGRISEQWRLVKREKEMTRLDMQGLHLPALFEQPALTWSPVVALQPAEWGFIQSLEKKNDGASNVDEMVKAGQEHLAGEAKRAILQALLSDITAKNALVFAMPETSQEKTL